MIKSNAWTLFKATYLVESICDYIEVLKDIDKNGNNGELWFRGHNNESWILRPNIMRDVSHIEDAFGNPIDPLNSGFRFGSTTIAFPNYRLRLPEIRDLALNRGYRIDNDIEVLAFGQHYGLQTPLIDWSEDPMVALFFALDGLKNSNVVYSDFDGHRDYEDRKNRFNSEGRIDSAAAILIMDPAKANVYSVVGKEMIFTSQSFSDKVLDELMNGKNYTFICLKTPKIGYRISRQSGNFLWQGNNYNLTADNNMYTHEYMYKIYIPYECYEDIKEDLLALRYTNKMMYGEYDEGDVIVHELREEQINHYKEAMGNLSSHINLQRD